MARRAPQSYSKDYVEDAQPGKDSTAALRLAAAAVLETGRVCGAASSR